MRSEILAVDHEDQLGSPGPESAPRCPRELRPGRSWWSRRSWGPPCWTCGAAGPTRCSWPGTRSRRTCRGEPLSPGPAGLTESQGEPGWRLGESLGESPWEKPWETPWETPGETPGEKELEMVLAEVSVPHRLCRDLQRGEERVPGGGRDLGK